MFGKSPKNGGEKAKWNDVTVQNREEWRRDPRPRRKQKEIYFRDAGVGLLERNFSYVMGKFPRHFSPLKKNSYFYLH